jgi:hypothetical protein
MALSYEFRWLVLVDKDGKETSREFQSRHFKKTIIPHWSKWEYVPVIVMPDETKPGVGLPPK